MGLWWSPRHERGTAQVPATSPIPPQQNRRPPRHHIHPGTAARLYGHRHLLPRRQGRWDLGVGNMVEAETEWYGTLIRSQKKYGTLILSLICFDLKAIALAHLAAPASTWAPIILVQKIFNWNALYVFDGMRTRSIHHCTHDCSWKRYAQGHH